MLSALVFREPVRALLRHKLRSALTTLGIMIGVAAVVLVVAIGKTASERAEAAMQNLGDNLVWIEAGSRNVAGTRTGAHGMTSLVMEDRDAILREVPLIKSCSPQIDGTVQLIHGNRNWFTHWRGETPEYLQIKNWPVVEGRTLSAWDLEQAASTMLIGKTVREQLFGSSPAVGEIVRAHGQLFEVAGVLDEKGQNPDGRDQDDWIVLPYTTAQQRIRGKGLIYLDDILCSAVRRDAVKSAIARIVALLRQRHQIRPGDEDDFNIRRPDEVIQAQGEASRTLSALLISIAVVSLLVGGIGIMNVMLASVVQRTREIGIRLAVGAKAWHVLVQFLAEAILLCLFGGVLGVALSVVGAWGFERTLGWTLSLSPPAVALAILSSVTVGVSFGMFPAWRAARLDPIVALRHE
jgi:putative ABC transport system permease protein